MSSSLSSKIAQLPDRPGIYIMKDRRGEVIYVGKAINLKSRVRSYFQKSRDESRLITRQIGEVRDVDILVTHNEKEAFILENNFIKQFTPKYNVLYRDDKSFASIKIPLNEPFPRPVITRKVKDKRAKYFGPYSNSKAARETLNFLHEVFPLRKCTLKQFNAAARPCLYGQMGKCLAPCCKKITKSEYDKLLRELYMFLNGHCKKLIEKMRAQMTKAADELDFETAAKIRDRINAVEQTVEQQLVKTTMDRVDRDVFGYYLTDKKFWLSVLFIRNGIMQDAANYNFAAKLDNAKAVLRSVVHQFYHGNCFIPDEVLLPVDTGEMGLLAEWLSGKKGKKVKVISPQRGRKKRIIEMASKNAAQAEKVKVTENRKRQIEMDSLQNLLDLYELPVNIECFDISNLSGREAAGSMVVFRNGSPDKTSYRRYKIRDIEGQNDFAMLRQVITRRYKKIIDHDEKGDMIEQIPELIVVDGGKAQLDAALNALAALQIPFKDIIGLAKARSRGGADIKKERVFMPGQSDPVELGTNTYAFNLLTRIRDEAHRFAISYHRKLRSKEFKKSPLTDIPGIGEKMGRRIFEHFKSLESVKNARIEDLVAVHGISQRKALEMRRYIDDNWTY